MKLTYFLNHLLKTMTSVQHQIQIYLYSQSSSGQLHETTINVSGVLPFFARAITLSPDLIFLVIYAFVCNMTYIF